MRGRSPVRDISSSGVRLVLGGPQQQCPCVTLERITTRKVKVARNKHGAKGKDYERGWSHINRGLGSILVQCALCLINTVHLVFLLIVISNCLPE